MPTAQESAKGGELGHVFHGLPTAMLTRTSASTEVDGRFRLRQLAADKYQRRGTSAWTDGSLGKVPDPCQSLASGQSVGGSRRLHVQHA
jgi:hypothetical protein